MRFKLLTFSFIVITMAAAINLYAAHPLITDDTGTAGKNGIQIEFAFERGHEKEDGVTEKTFEAGATLTYGILDSLDIVLGVPYQFIKIEVAGTNSTEKGISDISLDMKWRFFKTAVLNLAVKPGVSFPSGEEEKGLGTGKIGYSGYLISTAEMGAFAVHFNAGYGRNNNEADEEKNIWHGSLACEYSIIDSFKLVADIGVETNTDREGSENPAYVLGGAVYKINDKIAIDAGVKFGLNKPETDYTLLGGLTVSF